MLSKRLSALASFIDKNEVIADIGSDHALLLCQLAKEKKLKKGYAIDIKEGPLKQAKRNIANEGLANVFTILADGLHGLPSDVTVIVIAGMGFKSIKRILEDNWPKLEKVKYVIVQCNTQMEKFRLFLAEKQVTIEDEQWVKDYKDYSFIKFSTIKKRSYSKSEIFFGPILLKEKPLEFINYYRLYYQKLLEFYKIRPTKDIKDRLLLIEENLKDFI